MKKIVPCLSAMLFASACNLPQLNSTILSGPSAPAETSVPSETDPGAPLSAIPGDDVPVSEVGTGLDGQVFTGSLEGKPAFTGQGQTVASLGDPTVPGLWLETPLVGEELVGRVRSAAGAEVTVLLKPSGGDAASSSRLSISAMRALGVPLTELVEIQVLPAS